MSFGIDFGTTNSYLARASAGSAQVISSNSGSAIASRIEGEDGDLASVKRYLGRRAEELDELGLGYLLLEDEVRIPFGGKTFLPEELAARVFEKIQTETGVSPGQAVVAVPAHYDDAQRQATKQAAERAGIVVQRLVHEPTAAALACGTREERILVFDLGGGTLDLSLLEIEGDLFEVIRTSGDRNLGGDDLDLLVASALSSRLDVAFSRDLLEAARSLKHQLSDNSFAEVSALGREIALHRSELEDIAAPFLSRVSESLEDFKDCDPQALLLVGGMSRMPAVAGLLGEFFGMEPQTILEPETAVARGAALYADSLESGEGSLLLDVTPLSLGIEVEGEEYRVLVPANTAFPLFREKVFTTASDNQLSVEINILQGESSNPAENRLLGKMRLMGIPPAPAGIPQIWVAFEIDENGVLSAWVNHPESGLREEITISERAFADSAPGNE